MYLAYGKVEEQCVVVDDDVFLGCYDVSGGALLMAVTDDGRVSWWVDYG